MSAMDLWSIAERFRETVPVSGPLSIVPTILGTVNARALSFIASPTPETVLAWEPYCIVRPTRVITTAPVRAPIATHFLLTTLAAQLRSILVSVILIPPSALLGVASRNILRSVERFSVRAIRMTAVAELQKLQVIE